LDKGYDKMKNILKVQMNLCQIKQLEEIKNRKCVLIYIYIYISLLN